MSNVAHPPADAAGPCDETDLIPALGHRTTGGAIYRGSAGQALLVAAFHGLIGAPLNIFDGDLHADLRPKVSDRFTNLDRKRVPGKAVLANVRGKPLAYRPLPGAVWRVPVVARASRDQVSQRFRSISTL